MWMYSGEVLNFSFGIIGRGIESAANARSGFVAHRGYILYKE